MTTISTTSPRISRVLLLGCSALALSVPASANDVLFSTSATEVQAGQRTAQTAGLTQIRLTSGATVSITEGAEYTLNADGSIDLHKGSITASGAQRSPVEIRMPGGTTARVLGAKSSASFAVADDGSSSGHTLTGTVRVSSAEARTKIYRAGDMWGAQPGESPKRTIANAPQTQPGAEPAPTEVVAIGSDAGPVNAALNGIPVTLGDGLAVAGASSDIIDAGRRVEAAVGNPALDRFPSGDLALLIASAAELENAYGGTPFNAAQADIIRSYLGFLASGSSGAEFLTAYSAFALQYLELIRTGAAPSGFAATSAAAADIDAYLAFIERSGAIADLAATDQTLVDAYLRFLASGQDRDLFAASLTELTQSYLAFLRAGGVPTEFTGASDQALADAIGFLQQTGLLASLSANDQAFINAFIANGGAQFAAVFQQALADYFAFLDAGNLPSQFTALDQATLLAYIETLSNTGLLDRLPAEQAQFYADYLAFLQGGGNADTFAGLPGQPDFPAFAAALNAYATFLAANGLPSDFTETDIATLRDFFASIEGSGQANDLLGDNAALLSAYFAFLESGGSVDAFAGLPIYLDYVAALNAYFAFLKEGNLPSEYTVLDQATIEAYLAALTAAQGGLAGFGDLNDFFVEYFNFLLAGNDPDLFDGLPGMGGNSGGGTGGGNPGNGTNPTLVYTGGFDGSNVNLAVTTPEFSIIRSQPQFSADIADDGGLNAINLADNANLVRGTATTVDINGDENVLIGRWTDGTFTSFLTGEATVFTLGENEGFHYFITEGFTEAATFPEGRVVYDLAAATAPTVTGGSFAPGTFAGQMAIIFDFANADYQAAIDALISFDTFNVALVTDGGIDGDGADIFIGSRGSFEFVLPGMSNDDRSGNFVVSANFSKEDYSQFGATYRGFVSDATFSNTTNIQGAAIFNAVDDMGGGNTGGGGTGGGTGTGFTGTRVGQVYYTYLDGSLASGFGGSADFVDGKVTGFTSLIGTVSSNDAEIVEATDLEEVAWARWTNGTVQARGALGNIDSVIGASGGYHVMTGEVTTSLPGGTIAYELIGGTSATDNAGSAPGTLTGDLAIAFGSVSRVGYDLTMAVGGRSWAVSTQGGAADPTSSEINLVSGSAGFTFGGTFTNTVGTVTAGGDACALSCLVSIGGTLYGENAAYAALTMNVTDTTSSGVIGASGIAIFGQEGAATSTSVQAPLSATASADWSRWEVSASASSDAPSAMAPTTRPSLEAITARAATDRAGAIAQAEAMMGGMINWGGAQQ